jgi:hypothetical protein
MRHALPLCLSLCLAAACNDSGPSGSTDPVDMAMTTSPTGDMATTNPTPDLAMGPPQPTLVVAGSDFTVGSLSTVTLPSLAVQKNVDVLDKQPVVRAYGTKVYVLDQTRGALRTYDVTKNFQSPVDTPISHANVPAAQANPHDIYVDEANSKAYVTLYGAIGSTAVNSNTALGVIDLTRPQQGIASFITVPTLGADTDPNPDIDRIIPCGEYFYVTQQNIDRNRTYRPAGNGTLIRVNRVGTPNPRFIPLAGQNPVAFAVLPDCSEAIVGTGGDQLSGMTNGQAGLERVSNLTATPASGGLFLTDMQLGGNVSALDAVEPTKVFVDVSVKSGMTYNNTVYVVDAVARTRGAAVLGPMSYVSGVAVLNSQLVVLSAGAQGTGQLKPGLYIGPATGAALGTTPVDVGLPPLSVALVQK